MKRQALNLETSEAIALKALAFLAEDGPRLMRFLGLTGLEIAELREHAGSPRTQLAVLEHLLGDESLLLVFAANAGIAPDTVGGAHHIIAGSLGRGDG